MNNQLRYKTRWAKQCSVLLLFVFSMGALAEGVKSDVKEDLLVLDKALDRAFFLSSDADYLDHMLTEDFIYIHAGAYPIEIKKDIVKRKKLNQDKHKDNNNKAPFWHRDNMDVRIFNDSAIVSGFSIVGASETSSDHIKNHIFRVYVKKPPGWKLAYQQVNFNWGEDKGLYGRMLEYIKQHSWSE